MTVDEYKEREKKLCGPAGDFAFTAIVTPSTVDSLNALNKHRRILAITVEQVDDCIMAFRVTAGNPFGEVV